jgi:hypothetical protein
MGTTLYYDFPHVTVIIDNANSLSAPLFLVFILWNIHTNVAIFVHFNRDSIDLGGTNFRVLKVAIQVNPKELIGTSDALVLLSSFFVHNICFWYMSLISTATR